jgi:hypothetical protein
MVKAKYSARYGILYNSLGIMCSWCEPWNEQETVNPSLFRDTFSADPITPVQPQAAYYAMRTLCTVLDGATPHEVEVEFSEKKARFFAAGFKTGEGEVLLAVWVNERAMDECTDVETDIVIPGVQYKEAVGIDVLNGTRVGLQCARVRGKTVLKGMLIKDWPVVIRLAGGT